MKGGGWREGDGGKGMEGGESSMRKGCGKGEGEGGGSEERWKEGMGEEQRAKVREEGSGEMAGHS